MLGLDLKQTVVLRLEGSTHIERLVISSKSFLLVGSNGIIITFERSDDKHEPYIESKRLLLGGNLLRLLLFFSTILYKIVVLIFAAVFFRYSSRWGGGLPDGGKNGLNL